MLCDAALAQRAGSSRRGRSRAAAATHVDEPAAHGAALVRAGQLEPLDRAERLAVAPATARARGEHPVEALELREPERAGELARGGS